MIKSTQHSSIISATNDSPKESVSSDRDVIIDTLKVIAIIMVIITHDTYFANSNDNPLCVYLIDMAVPLFMLIGGINHASSMQRHSFSSKELPAQIIRRIAKYLIPYSITFVLVSILLVVFKNKIYTPCEIAHDFLSGGYGPGAYFTPIILQFVIIAPVLYRIISRYKLYGLFATFTVNLLFEISIAFWWQCPYYDKLVIRYLFIISSGMYIWLNKQYGQKPRMISIIISFLIGFLYLTFTKYLFHPIIFAKWTTTSMIVTFYIVPIVIILKCYCHINIPQTSTLIRILTSLSKATFHIYLVQMTYYYIGLCRFITVSTALRISVSVVFCLLFGVFFYMSSNLFSRKHN